MCLSRMLYLKIFCCMYLFKVSLTVPQCQTYTDLAGKSGTNCSHQSLVFVPHTLPLETEILLLNFNKITSISLSLFENLSKLKDLDLSNNQIQHFDPDYLLSIEKLNLSSNSLTRVPNFSNLCSLRKLILDHNKISALPEGAFDDLVLLNELSIRGNTVRVLPEHIFDPLEDLRYLTLSANKIEKFPDNLLQNLDELDTFDVSNNNLKTIPQDIASIILAYIYLYNNPWHCDCETVEFLREWIELNEGNIYNSSVEPDSESVVCLTPSVWEGTPIIHFPIEQNCHIVTTLEIIPETHTVTERYQMVTLSSYLLQTSPSLKICAPYTDLAGKSGVNCSHQSLVSVPHSLPLQTEILLLNFNNITSISLSSFENLSKLKDLDLSNNQIQHFDPDYPLSIEKLNLSSNSLTRVPNFSNLQNLRKLILDHNKISALPEGAFDDLVLLDELSIRGNTVRVVPELIFDPLEDLRYLTLSANKIEKFPDNLLQNVKQLDTFDVSNNNLTTIPQDFVNDVVPYIYLYNNPWHCDCETVEYLREWIELNEGNIYNSSTEPDSESVVCLTPSVWEGTPVTHFPIEQNCHIVTTPEIIPETHTVTERYQMVTLSNYLLQTSPSLEICAPYTDLAGRNGVNCSHQSLVSVPHTLPLETEILLLNFNKITSISLSLFENLSKLKDLDLSNNQIQHFDPDYPLSIEKLNLSSNSLTRVPNFSNLQNLRKLILDHNKISALPEGAFDDLVLLNELSIRGNTVRVLPEHIFDPLEDLRYLTLSANKIEKFPDNLLQNLEELDTFDVSKNNLKTIPQDIASIILAYIYLYNNPWHCDCETVEFLREWIELNEGNIYNSSVEPDSESVVCLTPSVWEGTPIIHFPIEQNCHIVTTLEIIPETHTVTERYQMVTLSSYLLQTSPSLKICAPYTDLAGKSGVNCSHQSLVSVPHSLPLQTEILLLNFNNITSISLSSFENLSKLKDLDLSNNQIQHFDPDYPLSIEKLNLSSNSLTRVPNFSNLRSLRKLILDHNKISALPEGAFDDLVLLDELSIRGNTVRVVPEHIFDPLEDLRYLTLSANKIEKFPDNLLQNVKQLDTFDVSNNNLTTIPQDFVNDVVPYIYLYNNPWHCDCETVEYLREWIELNEGNIYNSSTEPDSESVVCLTPSVWEGTPVTHFPIEQNCHIVTTPEIIPETHTVTERYQMVTLSNYLLQTSPSLEICAPYTDLAGRNGVNCSHQSLVSVPHSLPLQTEILLLNFNNITSISLSSFKNLSKLKYLDLSNNQIQHFDPDYPLSVEKLNLSSNSLTRVPNFSNLRSLRKLILDHNKISALPEGAFDDLVLLDELSIRGNTVRVVPEHIFDPLENLRYLTLTANKIKSLPNNSLNNLKNLTAFDVSKNELRTVPQDFFARNPVLCIHLYDNPWHCDCDIQYLSEWIKLNEDKTYRGEGISNDTAILCSGPSKVRGESLTQIPLSELCKASTPDYVTLTTLSSSNVQITTDTDLLHPTSPEGAVSLWERRFGLLEVLSKLGSSCLLLFILHCLSLCLLLVEICLLLFYILRFHRRYYAALKNLGKRRFNIRLVRYSLLVPDLRQIYPALSPGLKLGGIEETSSTEALADVLKSPSEGRGPLADGMETPADAFGSFL